MTHDCPGTCERAKLVAEISALLHRVDTYGRMNDHLSADNALLRKNVLELRKEVERLKAAGVSVDRMNAARRWK